MTIRIGNASSPRWYDLALDRLDAYIEHLAKSGATSTELVLHRGPADEHIRRVHVLEEDWEAVFNRYRAHGFVCHAHAPLHARFKLNRWETDPEGMRADFLPVLNAITSFSERQGAAAVLVVHAASGVPGEQEISAGFLQWAGSVLQTAGGATLAVELRMPRPAEPAGFDRSRASLAGFVRWLGHERVGICWDIAHDWESSAADPDWIDTPDADFLKLVTHVHLHDAGGDERMVHYPLQSGRVPWRQMLASLIESGFGGAITLEIRYRFALAMGEPWLVLAGSYDILASFLRENSAIEPGSAGHKLAT